MTQPTIWHAPTQKGQHLCQYVTDTSGSNCNGSLSTCSTLMYYGRQPVLPLSRNICMAMCHLMTAEVILINAWLRHVTQTHNSAYYLARANTERAASLSVCHRYVRKQLQWVAIDVLHANVLRETASFALVSHYLHGKVPPYDS